MNDSTFTALNQAVKVTQKTDVFYTSSMLVGEAETVEAFADLLNFPLNDRRTAVTVIGSQNEYMGNSNGVSETDKLIRSSLAASTMPPLSARALDENTYYVLTSLNYFAERAQRYAEFLSDYKRELMEESALANKRKALLSQI